MNYMSRHKKWTVCLIGAVMALAFLVTGAANSSGQVGRYRMNVVTRHNFTDIYIIDTVTGVVKYVGKNEGKPFEAISGK